LVAVVVQRVRIPYTVGLVIVGIIVPSDALGLDTPTALSPSVVLPLLLPPLLFEAAFALRWNHLAPVATPIGILATTGVVLSAAVTGGVLVLVIHLPWSVALLFGALMAATDPVAVVAFFQRARVAPELRALVEGESLLNDGTALVMVGVLGGLLTGGSLNPALATMDFLRIAVGGLAVGGIVGVACSVLARGTSDYLVEATVSVVAAYGSYVLGEQLHVSGVLAVVIAGSVFGNFGRRFGLSEGTQEAVDKLWRFLAFVSNSLVFLLLGLAVVPGDLVRLGPLLALGIGAALLGRAVVAYGMGAALARFAGMPPLVWRHVLFWGGLRGALPVVIAIVVTEEFPISFPLRDLVLGVVAATLIVQGLTLEPVCERVLRSANGSDMR
jgi:CPA1 family monovalent cation:H+ antiporter